MMTLLKHLFGNPSNHVSSDKDIRECDRDGLKEHEIKASLSDLAQAVAAMERKSWEVRHELANRTLRIVGRDKGW